MCGDYEGNDMWLSLEKTHAYFAISYPFSEFLSFYNPPPHTHTPVLKSMFKIPFNKFQSVWFHSGFRSCEILFCGDIKDLAFVLHN